jgi:hypothetical protein
MRISPGALAPTGIGLLVPNRISPSSKPRQLPTRLTSILQHQYLPPPFQPVKLDILPHRHAPRGSITLLPTSYPLHLPISHHRSLKGGESSRSQKKEPRALCSIQRRSVNHKTRWSRHSIQFRGRKSPHRHLLVIGALSGFLYHIEAVTPKSPSSLVHLPSQVHKIPSITAEATAAQARDRFCH